MHLCIKRRRARPFTLSPAEAWRQAGHLPAPCYTIRHAATPILRHATSRNILAALVLLRQMGLTESHSKLYFWSLGDETNVLSWASSKGHPAVTNLLTIESCLTGFGGTCGQNLWPTVPKTCSRQTDKDKTLRSLAQKYSKLNVCLTSAVCRTLLLCHHSPSPQIQHFPRCQIHGVQFVATSVPKEPYGDLSARRVKLHWAKRGWTSRIQVNFPTNKIKPIQHRIQRSYHSYLVFFKVAFRLKICRAQF